MKKLLYFLAILIGTAWSWEAGTEDNPRLHSVLDGNAKMYEVTLDLRTLGGDLTVDTEPISKADDGTNDLCWFQITS